MNVPKRMPVFRSADAIRRQWLTSLCAIDGLYGLVNVFGKAEGSTWLALRNMLPIPMWGALLFGSAVLIWGGWSMLGGIGGGLAWGFLAGAAGWTILRGTAPSYGGPILLGGMCWWHVLVIYEVGSGLDADRERRQRG